MKTQSLFHLQQAKAHRLMRCFGALLLLLAPASVGSAADAPSLQYNRDIRPILANACFACHGPDSASRKADLRVDQREAALEMEAFVPGEPDESELIRRILSSDPDEMMPPPEIKKTLTAVQKEQLARWIKEGAQYELHWSFIPPVRPAPPTLKNANWARNPIDNFVGAQLAEHGLAPAKQADRRTLARRVSLDITGLPPQPATVEAFVNDASPNAYEKLVDTLLGSKRWGEHRARYWLDYARYADTHGIHFDNYREMWAYRDWVINAFNQNMPFDQFTIENLAGDLLPNRTLNQQIASGFNRCNMTTNEGGIIDEEYRVLYARDRVETTSLVWLGLTAGCAVCHSHKFDPLSQTEFYQLAAFFNNTTQRVRDGNVKDTPPIVIVPRSNDAAQWKALPGLIATAKKAVEDRKTAARPEHEKWLAAAEPSSIAASLPTKDLYLQAGLDEGQGKAIQVVVDGAVRTTPITEKTAWQATPTGYALQTQGEVCELPDVGDFGKQQAFTCTAWVKLPANDGHGAICARMDNAAGYRGWDMWMQRRQIGMHIVNAWPQNALKVVAKNQVPANRWVHVAVSYDGSGKAAGVQVYYDGVVQKTNVENDKLTGPIQTPAPFKIGQRNTSDPLSGVGLQNLRIYRRVLSPGEVESLGRLSRLTSVLAKAAEQRTDKEKSELYTFWLGSLDKPFQLLNQKVASLERERKAIQGRGTISHVMQEKDEPPIAFVLTRGEYDKRGQQVAPGTPEVLPAFPEGLPRNRLGLAKWLLLPNQPLTARVTVNRYWQEVFGRGIVKTSGDFGVSGELPTHPKLLDWLAVEFRESGWDVKKLIKLMVMSATYQQAAAITPKKREVDPENRLLARGPRFRMDAEMVRDYALAVSGLLSNTIGGPSVKPYQPPGVWEAIAMNVSNTRSYEQGTGDDLYRRSFYTFIKRMAPPASMDIFDAPNREYCVTRRERTNTPLQALVTLNDVQFVEAARHLAQQALQKGGNSFNTRLKYMSLRLISREFRADEAAIIQKSLHDLHDFYQAHPDDAEKIVHVGESKPEASLKVSELAAWTMLANELLNLDEVLNQ